MPAAILLLILAVIGLLLWVLAPGKLSETGRIIFFCAFLALCFGATPHWFVVKAR